MAVKDKPVMFSFPMNIKVVSFRGNVVEDISDSMNALLDSLSMDRDTILNTLGNQEDGSFPIILDDKIMLSTSLSTPDLRISTLKETSRLELEEWLEIFQGGKPSILTDGTGEIYAMTESAGSLFSGLRTSSMRELLDQVSMTAFVSAGSKCLSGKQLRSFSVLTGSGLQNKRSFVVSLQKVGIGNRLMQATFSSPSMAMGSLERDDSKFVKTLFSCIPVPAMKVNSNGTIIALNSHATHVISNSGGWNPVSKELIGWISHEDRARVSSLLESRSEAKASPVQFRAGVALKDNVVLQCEMTSISTIDGNTLLFFIPLEGLRTADTDSLSGQTMRELIDLLHELDLEDDPVRTLLEFLRLGTGASGVLFVSRSRRVAVGDAPLSNVDSADIGQKEQAWSEDHMGFNLTIPLHRKHDQAQLRITGLPTRDLGPFDRFILQLVPMMLQYALSHSQVAGITGLLSSFSDFMNLLKGRDRNARAVLDNVGSIINADYLVIHTVSSREPVLKPAVASPVTAAPGILPLETPSIASWAFTHNEDCYVPDTALDHRFSPVFQSSRSEVSLPLICDGRAMGTITVGSRHRDAFSYPMMGVIRTMTVALSLWLFRSIREDRDDQVIRQDERPLEHIGLDDLLLSLSYRMRAPITTLRGHTDLLISEKLGELSSDQKTSLTAMNTAMIELVEYAERMLTFMKIELSEDNLETIWARPSDVVSSLLPILSEKGKNQSITVSAELPSDPFTASFDRSRLEQIIGNLVNNAISYNEPDGSVTINVRLDNSSHWILEVFNTGPGIPPENLPHVFDRFFTGTGHSGASRGLGIGLTIVKSFAQQMGGTVSVRCRSGYGTWFAVRLPLS